MQVISNTSELDLLIKNIEQETHSRFVSLCVERGYSDQDWQPLPANRVYWQWSCGNGSPTIEFTGVPFMFVGFKKLGCHRGKDRALSQKRRYAEKKAKKMMIDYSTLSMTSVAPQTKKVGCPASISITKIAMFPKFKVNDNRERSRRKASKMLKESLERDPVVWECCYYVIHQGEHSGHEMDDAENGKKRRRQRQRETSDSGLSLPKRPRKTYLKKKCIKLTKQVLDKLYFLEDQKKLQELSGKLSSILDDLPPLSNSENERPLHLQPKRARVSLKAKYPDRVGVNVCRKTTTQVPEWPVHTVAGTL